MLSGFILLILFRSYFCYNDVVPLENATQKQFIYNNTYEYDSIIDLTVNETATHILDFNEQSNLMSVFPTRVHVSTNDTLDLSYPLFVTAAQQKGVSSWELPLVVSTKQAVLKFNDMARTLCPHDAGPNVTSQGRPTLTLATSSPSNVSVRIKLRRVEDFFIEVNKDVNLNVTPSTPKYYYFSFDRDPWKHLETKHPQLFPRFNYTIPKSVLLEINSNDHVCATVSIQNNSCPVFDNEKDMMYQGYHFTMTTKGGITVTQSMFPRGFYIVFIVKESDEECTGISGDHSAGSDKRTKNFSFRVMAAAAPADYLTLVLVSLALPALVALLAPTIMLPTCRASRTIEVEEAPGPSGIQDPRTSETTRIIGRSSHQSDSDIDSEPDIDDKSLPIPLNVARLSRTRPLAHNRRSNRYFWSALTVAVVYALPVVQLLFTYQRMALQTGDQDVCYYNFLCALPLGALQDFNHVFSNVGYVLLGLAFMLQVRCRPPGDELQELGIPEHRGLMYSMGLALIMEGLLSACYHLCPNKMNFQFDSSFMYVIAVLCIVKLYQSRHSDVNASAHATFMLLAFLMAIGVFGIVYPNLYFWTFFTIGHLAVCFFLTLKIYYVGRMKIGSSMVKRAWGEVRRTGRSAFRPKYPARAVFLALANLANWALAGYGMYEHNADFARHLLAVLLGNAILYTLAYVVLKLAHAERVCARTWGWLLLAAALWALAAALFLHSRTKWSQTAAQSRTYNAQCTALQSLDTHDLWHLSSAAAIFSSFNALLIIDDPLATTPRIEIPVF
ncbi:SID1 transmembrane family member 1-like isoform X1 [Vanessa atalanta]|uniref:SID1 transmembrane family member 1-like isoform X1 n=1 Tax=Vanessa atalanta TaxID=42275 RepID=UPI001FCDD7DE|nr:SID1 transmembrane family member 1-like isoform X1 [Vanessa atalanta]